MSYYGKRAARDPAWHDQQLREAAAREARRRERDPERVRAIRRAASARHRARQRAHGLTFQELWLRVGGDRELLAWALRDEVRLGRVDYRGSTRRYELNGGLPADAVAALRGLDLAPPPAHETSGRRRPVARETAGGIAACWPDGPGGGDAAIRGTRGALR